MMPRMRLAALLVLIFLTGCVAQSGTGSSLPQGPRISEGLAVAGSGSNLALTGKLIEVYNREFGEKVEIPISIGSSGGIKAVADGAIDIALTSRPLKESEKIAGLKEIPYARVAVVIGVNQAVPDDNISYQDLVDIFGGRKVVWKNGQMIVVLSREGGDSSNSVLAAKVPGFADVLKDALANKRWQIAYTDADEFKAIINTPYSLGLADSGSIKALDLPVKGLKVNGIAPTAENVATGAYELSKDLFFVYKEPLSKQAKGFLDIVFSSEGEKIITKNGAIPLKGK